MSTKWTNSQINAITKKDSNILVSAAAGSGKTAVLVERIINKIVNEKIDIDRLLVVTFTNAAAAEMRERILNAIYKKLDEDPTNLHLQRQVVLLNKANISTIHSFCLEVIRNNFYKLDIAPNFRLADKTEIELLKTEVLEELFEELYEEENPEFINLINTYTSYRDDSNLKELVLKIYNFIQSTPFPEDWLETKIREFNVNTEEDFAKTIWGKILVEEYKEQLKTYISILHNAEKELDKSVELQKYTAIIADDINKMENILKFEKWEEIYDASNIKFSNWPSDKKITIDKKDLVKKIRDSIKKEFNDTNAKLFIYNSKQANEDIKSMYSILKELETLVIKFSNNFHMSKLEKNIIDFNDMEHYAADILLEKNEDGNWVPTDIAKAYQEKFIEIAIDEYQDSNLVQEQILTSVSKGNNIFMVGDIKQSIYKFRHARPELFKEKYETYGENRIQLYDNFRSRQEIIHATNEVFKAIMGKEIGDVDYNEQEFLHLGADFPSLDGKPLGQTELHIINMKEKENTDEILEKEEVEAKFVARQIQDIIENEYYIYDKDKGYRKATFRDCVILLRTTSGVTEFYENELNKLNYPVFTDNAQVNYLDSLEVRNNYILIKNNK